MYFSTLSEWLVWVGSLHLTEIELGLDRVKEVAKRLDVLTPTIPIIIVGGTNGKGSTVAGLEAIYRAAGYHVGAFTSPILFKHNEQVRIDGCEASDEAFCQAFEKIAAVRADVSLTPFEFCTLAALVIFQSHDLDVLILEVGLGGRLDAVNIIDADAAIVTSIGIDHVEWLGNTRKAIAYEKAGIFRKDKPAICGDLDVPYTLIEHAAKISAPLFCQGKDFYYQETQHHWSWTYHDIHYADLPRNELATQNMSSVLMAVTLLQKRLPVTRSAIDKGLTHITLPARIQIVNGPVTEIYDVSHNPAAVAFLASRLQTMDCQGKTLAVFSMLADKDISESIRAIGDVIDEWYIAPLQTKRAAAAATLRDAFQHAEIRSINVFTSVSKAYAAAISTATAGDRVVVFGSFHTVAEVWGDNAAAMRMPRAAASTLCTRK